MILVHERTLFFLYLLRPIPNSSVAHLRLVARKLLQRQPRVANRAFQPVLDLQPYNPMCYTTASPNASTFTFLGYLNVYILSSANRRAFTLTDAILPGPRDVI